MNFFTPAPWVETTGEVLKQGMNFFTPAPWVETTGEVM